MTRGYIQASLRSEKERGPSPVILDESINQKRTLLQMMQHCSATKETPTSESIQHPLDQPIDVTFHLVQHHAQMARLLAGEIIDEEVESLVCKRYSRDRPAGKGYVAGGKIPARSGSVANASRSLG